MRNFTILLSGILMLLVSNACASYRDNTRTTFSKIGIIGTRDLGQADYLNRWLSQVPEIKDRYTVTAKAGHVDVSFKDDLPAGKDAIFKERVLALKNQMKKDLGYKIGVFIFTFPSQEIKI